VILTSDQNATMARPGDTIAAMFNTLGDVTFATTPPVAVLES
jgi:hypothetical protein